MKIQILQFMKGLSCFLLLTLGLFSFSTCHSQNSPTETTKDDKQDLTKKTTKNLTFVEAQLKHARVKVAKEETHQNLVDLFIIKGLVFPAKKVFVRVFKAESQLELWAENPTNKQFVLIKTYPVCAMSGILGGKNKFGDMQVPEGFYYIDAYNPNSSYYLSVKINYPNAYDKFWKKTGDNICIHGYCASIGCVSIEDDPIKELYWALIQAKSAGQEKIPVHIFPTQLAGQKFESLQKEYANESSKINFWTNIKQGYDYFEQTKQIPNIKVEKGLYVIAK
jgi:murein L,D-transpeptidase YafK